MTEERYAPFIKRTLLSIIKNKKCTGQCAILIDRETVLACPLAIQRITSINLNNSYGETSLLKQTKVTTDTSYYCNCMSLSGNTITNVATQEYIKRYGEDALFEELL